MDDEIDDGVSWGPGTRPGIQMFVVYRNPSDAKLLIEELCETNGLDVLDAELQYFVRRHVALSDGKVYAAPKILLGADTLDAARAGLLAVRPKLVNIGRMNIDDPVVVEVWL